MAACREVNVEETDKSEPSDPRLDFFSDKFDPLLALQTPNLKIPVPTAKCYDNLGILQSHLGKHADCKQKTAEPRKQQVEPVAGSSKSGVESGRRFLPHQMPVQKTNTKTKSSIYTKMEKMAGPLSLLRKCKDERIKVKIWTRHSHGIRGFCIAYIVAFDKHWNLALEEVTEVWKRLRKSKVPATDSTKPGKYFKRVVTPPKVTVVNKTDKFEICKRQIHQIMMRGEHIAFICILKNYDESEHLRTFV